MKLLPPPTKEPFFAPGGLWTLAYVATVMVVMFIFSEVLGVIFIALGWI